ncbi:DUF928 domain-containing protein [Flavisolibacter nicotianae]|uniref:DUF928 domain-containing protein n=1 Tax=Flavisolibacter nicotianae TaxID=2364882 RepID=UPI000EB20C6F|nr:DUF928 domain-containing protein [Flavisolibacter nicotianae]
MNKSITKWIFALLLLLSSKAYTQISVQFSPIAAGRSLQGLATVQIMSTFQTAVQVALTIRVKEVGGTELLSVKTPEFLLNHGVNFMDRNAFSNARFSFSADYAATVIKQTGNFPEGDYEYCFEIAVISAKDPAVLPFYEQCFTFSVQPITPLLLMSPIEGDVLCNKRPTFIWQPPMPLASDASFRLLLAEVKEKQNAVEAISFNTPVINQAQIRINSLAFPVNIPDLKDGATYAWQVTVYAGKTILKKSEIWEFKVQCREEKNAVENDGYREVKERLDGHVYYAYGKLRFFFSNPYNEGKLAYRIYPLADKQEEVKGLPTMKVINGYNQFEIDLSELKPFKDGKDYLLKVWLADNKILQLRFVYKEI